MPSLSCVATNCIHNKNNCCCLSNIKVDGAGAHTSEKTCCRNFAEHHGHSNASEHPCACLSIDSRAVDCAYNEDCICGADRVDICGHDARNCSQTECATFDAKERR